MAIWEVFDVNETKLGEMTQDELDTRMSDSNPLDGLNYFFYDVNIFTDLTEATGSEGARVVKVVEDAPEV